MLHFYVNSRAEIILLPGFAWDLFECDEWDIKTIWTKIKKDYSNTDEKTNDIKNRIVLSPTKSSYFSNKRDTNNILY